MNDRAPLLPERARDAVSAHASSSRGGWSRARVGLDACADALVALDRRWNAALDARDDDEVCGARVRRVRRATALVLGGMMVIAGVSGRGGRAARAGARLGDAGDDWIQDLISSNALDLRRLDFGPRADDAPLVDPNTVGGKSSAWAQEFAQYTTPGSYDTSFDGRRRYSLKQAHASTARVERAEPREVAPKRSSSGAVRNDDPMSSYLGDVLKSAGVSTEVLSLGADVRRQSGDGGSVELSDLIMSAPDAKHSQKVHEAPSEKKESHATKSSRHSDDVENERHAGAHEKTALQKFFSAKDDSISKSKKHIAEREEPERETRKGSLASMIYSELKLHKNKRSSTKDRIEDHKYRSSSSSGSLRQYPSRYRRDSDENDENDNIVFYKKSDLLDLGEYDQATIDDFRYGQGLEPRSGGKSKGIEVDTSVDVSSYPTNHGGSYPGSRYPAKKDDEDMEKLMSSLKVDSKAAAKHAAGRKQEQTKSTKADKTSKLSESDWSGDTDKTDSVKVSSKSKSSKVKTLSTSDWTDEAKEPAKKSVKSTLSKDKVSKNKLDVMDWAEEPKSKKSKRDTSTTDDTVKKIGKMSKEDAAKYLSKVKGHNEKTHAHLREVIPKLGAKELSYASDDKPQFADVGEDGHKKRHSTIAKVVEAAALEDELPHEASLGRKPNGAVAPATKAEIAKGGAWRKVFTTFLRGNASYRKARAQIFDPPSPSK